VRTFRTRSAGEFEFLEGRVGIAPVRGGQDVPRPVRDDVCSMSDEPPSKVLGALPRTRPHRRSDKRAAPAGNPVGSDLRLTAGAGGGAKASPPPAADPPDSADARKPLPAGANVVGTAVQAAAELAEIGLSVSARALRGALSRLPRP
jgi:hypothetical protein